MDKVRFPKLIKKLYSTVSSLETMFGRPFTPDGHMVGSLGEALAAYHYGLKLARPSTRGYDAIKNGRRIEIKATQGEKVSFRHEPDYVIVLKLSKDGTFEEVYNGAGGRVWAQVVHKEKSSSGQHQIGLGMLRRLSAQVADAERIKRVIP